MIFIDFFGIISSAILLKILRNQSDESCRIDGSKYCDTIKDKGDSVWREKIQY